MQKNWLYFIATGQRADLKSEPLTFSDLLDPKILRIDKELVHDCSYPNQFDS